MQELHKLDEKTSRVLRKEIVVTGAADVVRELVENAIDADAKRIQIYLENYGMKRIEVRDDGHGIPTFSLNYIVNGGYTSKAEKTENLSRDEAYGFRGEALSGICSVGNLTITSKSATEPRAVCAEFDQFGRIKHEAKTAHSKGTIVVVTDLFSRSPVRCKYLNALPQLVHHLKEVEQFLKLISIINYQCHITLAHNGNSIWTKPNTFNIEQAFCSVWGLSVSKQLQKCKPLEDAEKDQIVKNMELYVPRLPIDRSMLCSSNKMTTIYVNKKAVQIREFEKALKEHICPLAEESTQGNSSKYPVCVLSIEVSSQNVDFNRDLDKRKVFLVHKEEILEKLKALLDAFYGTSSKENQDFHTSSPVSIADLITEPSVLPTTKTLEERQSNIMNFLNEIPVAGPLNFTRSPSKAKVPVDRPPAPVAVVNVNHADTSGTRSFQLTELTSPMNNEPPLIAPSSKHTSPPGIVGKNPNMDTGKAINDKDWIHGRVTDSQGNIIESTILVRAEPKTVLRDDGLGPSRQAAVPSNITSRTVFGNTSSTPSSKPWMEQFRGKRNDTPGPRCEIPQKKMKHSDSHSFSQSQAQTSQTFKRAIGRPVGSEPRQVTLDKFKNWPQPTDTFSKTNVIYSIIQPSPRTLEKSAQNTQSPVVSTHTTPAKSVELQRNSGPPLITSFLTQREMLRSGTLGLREKIPLTPAMFLPTTPQSEPQVVADTLDTVDTFCMPAVIGKLDYEHPLFIVKINTMLGVLSPMNLLEMEPKLQQKLDLDKCNSTDLSNDLVQTLALEFSQLSYEDYEESQVRRVFWCLKDFGEADAIDEVDTTEVIQVDF